MDNFYNSVWAESYTEKLLESTWLDQPSDLMPSWLEVTGSSSSAQGLDMLPACGWLSEPQHSDEWVGVAPLAPEPSFKINISSPPSSPLDLSKGIGKAQSKQDLVALERLLCEEGQWMVYHNRLCFYEPPCWMMMENHTAEVQIRRMLRGHGYDDCLVPRDYRDLRSQLFLNPEIQMAEAFPANELKLNLLDGTLDVLTNELRPHDPEDGFFHYVDMTIGELFNAPSTGAFDSFADLVLDGNQQAKRQLLELTGLALTNCPLKSFYVLLGPSHTGKSQFGRFLEELVGREFVETLRGVDDFGDKWTMGALFGKRLVTCLDLPDEPLSAKAIGAIKQLVGDDPVKGEYKGGNPFTFYEKPMLLCAGNFPIRVPNIEKESALINRMVTIPFVHPIAPGEERQHFYLTLLEDSPYIVRCAAMALQGLAARNFQVIRAEIPGDYAPEEGNRTRKSVQAFVENTCELDENAEVTTETLFRAYNASSEACSLSEIEFSRLLSRILQPNQGILALKRAAGTEKRGYRGICINGAQK